MALEDLRVAIHIRYVTINCSMLFDVGLSGTYGLNGDMMQIKPSHVRVRNLDARRPSQGLADLIFRIILNRWSNDV